MFSNIASKTEYAEAGGSLVEFVICLPILLLVAAIICDLGYYATNRMLVSSEATDAVRYIEMLSSPKTEENNESQVLLYFNENGTVDDTSELVTIIKDHLNDNYGTRMPAIAESTPNRDQSRFTISISGKKLSTYSAMDPTSIISPKLDNDSDGNWETYNYYLYSPRSTENTFLSRQSSFESYEVDVTITYKADYFFQFGNLINMAAGHSDANFPDSYTITSTKKGIFYVGGSDW